MNSMSLEDKLALNKYDIDEELHISVNEDICRTCRNRVCLHICPAECFKLLGEKITYSYEGCLECGSCRLACSKGAINWTYPRGGFGIAYQYG